MQSGIIGVIEFGNKYLKYLLLKTGASSAHVVEAKALDISHASREELLTYIKTNIKSSRVKKYMLCIPRSIVILRNLSLPSHDLQEVSQMIDLHIEKQVPHSKDEIVSAWDFVGVDEGGFGKVLLGIIQRDTMSNIFGVLEEAGVYVNKAYLGTSATIAWFLYASKDQSLSPDKTYIALNVDREETELIVFAKGKAVFSRVINLGALQLADGAQTVNRLLGEIRQSFLLIPGVSIEKKNVKIYCTGATEQMGFLIKYLRSELQVEAELFVITQKLALEHFSGKPEDNPLNKFSYTALAGAGVSLREENKLLSFTLPELAIRSSMRESAHQIIILGGIVVYIIGVAAGLFAENIYLKKNYLESVLAQNQDIAKKHGELNEMFNKIEVASKFLNVEESLLTYAYQLHTLVPEDVSFTALDIDQDQISMKGVSKSTSAVFKFTTALEKSKYFTNVETKYTRKKITPEEELTEFALTCKLEKA
jgi:hypothetical protein